MPPNQEYEKMLTELVQKQMLVLGPKIALDKARKIAGLSVTEAGEVRLLAGDPKLALKGIAGEYMDLSEQIAKMTLDALMEKYPAVKNLQKEE